MTTQNGVLHYFHAAILLLLRSPYAKVRDLFTLQEAIAPYREEFYSSGKRREKSRSQGADLSPRLSAIVDNFDALSRAYEELSRWRERGISVVTYEEELYPSPLKTIADPPLMLFYKGYLCKDKLHIPRLAIVGSRKAGVEACQIARIFAQSCVKVGGCVVSGLAYGVDAAAHRGALEGECSEEIERYRLPTIAVIGNGLDDPYPAMHKPLIEQILDKGGIVFSQFEPGAKPLPYHFINRNRIIAGLSEGVVVVEAATKSGSLATARFALEQGREVMAVPGSILSSKYTGAHLLIQQGATLVQSFEDIQECVEGLRTKPIRKKALMNSPQEKTGLAHPLVEHLKEYPHSSFDELREHFPTSTTLMSDLCELELSGAIMREPGDRYMITLPLTPSS